MGIRPGLQLVGPPMTDDLPGLLLPINAEPLVSCTLLLLLLIAI